MRGLLNFKALTKAVVRVAYVNVYDVAGDVEKFLLGVVIPHIEPSTRDPVDHMSGTTSGGVWDWVEHRACAPSHTDGLSERVGSEGPV